MIIGTGIDIIEVERIRKAAEKPSFCERIFTERERRRFSGFHNDPQRMAGIFAAKEAIAKAIGTGFGPIDWREIEILHEPSGKPYVELSGNAKEAVGEGILHISISHIKDIAAAQAILESNG